MAGLLGGSPAPAPPMMMPALEEPKVMPIPDDEARKRDELRRMALAGRGRTSRAMTVIGADDYDSLG